MLKCNFTIVFVVVVKHSLLDQSLNAKQSKELVLFCMVDWRVLLLLLLFFGLCISASF